MHIVEITLQHRRDGVWPTVLEHRRTGDLTQRREGELGLHEGFDFELRELGLSRDVFAYGTYLGEALFQGKIGGGFERARGSAEDADEPLQLLLVVEEPALKPLRWERLCAPDAGGAWDFLALDHRTLYSRYLPSLSDRRFPSIGRRDLRALVVLADPPADNRYGLDPFDAAQTAATVGGALAEIPCDVLGPHTGAAGPATLDALCDRIVAEPSTLLHVVAHGLYRDDGETVLYLLDRAGKVAPVTATELIKRLGRLKGARGLPRLAFLATCEGAKPDAEAALGGLAQRLVRDLGMPAVVAMTDPVSIETAGALASGFYTRLRVHGEADRALVEATGALQGRSDILVPALFSRLEGRPLFSDALDRGPLTDTEIDDGLRRLENLLPERAPVLVDKLAEPIDTVRGLIGTDPDALSETERKERDGGLKDLDAACERVLDLSFQALARDQLVPAYDARCPFPGLKAFQTDEREFFKGREDEVEKLTSRLRGERFLAVSGGSGSGKSSLVLAGIVPRLTTEAAEQGYRLQGLYPTPGADPEVALAQQLDALSSPDAPTLLVVDQFEELFTICTDPAKRKAFLDALIDAWESHPNLLFVLTLRTDFLSDCTPYPRLKALLQEHLELIAPMDTAQLRSAVEQQADRVGLRFEADLAHTILAEVEGEPGAMPLLQHLLLQLWKRRHGRWLLASEYRALGGIRQAIAHTADEIYWTLDKDEQSLARNLFVRLTKLDEKQDADGRYRDTRQRVSLRDLVPVDADSARVHALVTRLADRDARLLVTTTNPSTQETEVEVSHEALIRHWPRLRTWLDEDRESWILLASVRQQAKDWKAGGERPNDLPRWGERLQQAEALFEQVGFGPIELEQKFLAKSRLLAERELREKAELIPLPTALLDAALSFER